MGNNRVCKIFKIEDVYVETNLGCKLVIKDVQHIPDMRLHLILVGVLDDDEYQSYFLGGWWKLLRQHLVVARGFKFDSLYMNQVKICGKVNILKYNSINL
jgi:hypothetical protein